MTATVKIHVDDQRIRAVIDEGNGEYEVKAPLRWTPLETVMVDTFDRWLMARKLDSLGDFQALGELLYYALLGNDVGTKLRNLVSNASIDSPVRIRLDMSDRPDLAALPWEFLRDPGPPDVYYGTDPRIRLLRYRPQPFPPAADRTTLDVLLVVCEPDDWPTVAAGPVVDAARQLGHRHDANVTCEDGVEFPRFFHLVQRQPDVVHFIGHGRYDWARNEAELAFIDDDGSSPKWVKSGQLLEAFNVTRPPRLVVLQCCESGMVDSSSRFTGFVPGLLERGVPAVVAMQYPIRVAAAVDFATALYQSLDADEPVDTAVQAGRLAVNGSLASLRSEREFGAPVLYLRGTGRLLPEAGDGSGEADE